MATKINSPAELKAFREKVQAELDLRGAQKDMRITVHMGTCGIAAGARDVLMALMGDLADSSASTVIHQASCAGLCDQEPMITVDDKSGHSYRYGKLTRDKVRQIVQKHVEGGKPVQEYLLKD